MAELLHRRAQDALRQLQEGLEWYAKQRQPGSLVGQFLDLEACRAPQRGVYGVSTWLTVTAPGTLGQEAVQLREACKAALVDWVRQSTPPDTDLRSAPDSEGYELRFIVPKICYAFTALNQFTDCTSECAILRQRIEDAQLKHDGSWAFTTEASQGDLVATALVLRCFQKDVSLAPRLAHAADHLKAGYRRLQNHYHRLYVLNTLAILDTQSNILLDARSCLISSIRQLYAEAYTNPAKFPNPCNIDFHDSNRTRYIRLPSDIILLESLLLISHRRPTYLWAHTGRELLSDLLTLLNAPTLTKDLSGHRLTTSVAAYLADLLNRLQRLQDASWPDLAKRAAGWLLCSWHFGLNFAWNVLASGFSILGLTLCYWLGYDLGTKLFAGVLLKSVLDVVRSIFHLARGKADG